jgi:uncharacterized protein (TIGR02466 family)
MVKNEVYPLFSTPVLVSYSDEPPFTKVLDYCKTLEYAPNKGSNYISLVDNILDNPVFSEIKVKILQAIDEYTKGVMKWERAEFYITQSWVNVNPKGTEHHAHYHYNSLLSGVYYLQTAREDHIKFINDPKPVLELEKSEYNIWNSNTYLVPVKDNSITIFPSSTMHSVDAHTEEDYERISIAFNMFVRGTLGSRESMTYLEL